MVSGVTCGAGMPYKLSEIAAQYGVYYLPIISSARAFRALRNGRRHGAGHRTGGEAGARVRDRPVARLGGWPLSNNAHRARLMTNKRGRFKLIAANCKIESAIDCPCKAKQS